MRDLELNLLLNFHGHGGGFYWVVSEGSTSIFCRCGGRLAHRTSPSVGGRTACECAELQPIRLPLPFWSKGIDDFFEARVAAQRIIPRQQFKSAITEETG